MIFGYKLHTNNILAVIALASILFLSKGVLDPSVQTTESAMLALSLQDLSRQAELIIQVKVLGEVDSITCTVTACVCVRR